MNVTGLSIYPFKSITGLQLERSIIVNEGLKYDRNWALVDRAGKVVTARDFPKLLHLTPQLEEDYLQIFHNGVKVLRVPFETGKPISQEVQIFSSTAEGVVYPDEINTWFSNYLGIDAKLLVVDTLNPRNVKQAHGGRKNDVVGFADQNPILLISEASLQDLNSKLKHPVTMTHFRPNIVVSGCEPFAEDTWKNIKIGACEFEVVQSCKRCVFTTIDPITTEKDPNQEPIRTLSSYRGITGGIAFGMHAIPRKTGEIVLNDEVCIL